MAVLAATAALADEHVPLSPGIAGCLPRSSARGAPLVTATGEASMTKSFTPTESSKVIPILGSRPVRVEIASSQQHTPTCTQEKISTLRVQQQRQAARSFSLHTCFTGLYRYTISSSHGPKTSSAAPHKVPAVACRYLLFTAISGGPCQKQPGKEGYISSAT